MATLKPIEFLERIGQTRLARSLEMVSEFGRQFMADRSFQAASALAFTTIITLVPIMAVSFALLKAFVADDALANTVRNWILSSFLADSVSGVTDYLDAFLKESAGGAVGLVGLAFLLVTSISLFLSVENAFNTIWRVPMNRQLYRRLVTFYAIITLTPMLIAIGSISATWILGALEVHSIGVTVGGMVSFTMVFVALTLMYKLLPHTHVTWRSAVGSGVLASAFFQLARFGFNTYVTGFYTGSVSSQIYGTFALVPIFFLWVYLLWLIILSGVTAGYMVQHHKVLTRALLQRRRLIGHSHAQPSGYMTARVFYGVAQNFFQRGGGTDPAQLALHLQLEAAEIDAAILLLSEAELLLNVTHGERREVVPGRPLEQIEVKDLYALCERQSYQVGELPKISSQALDRVAMAAHEKGREILGVTVASLLAEDVDSSPPTNPH